MATSKTSNTTNSTNNTSNTSDTSSTSQSGSPLASFAIWAAGWILIIVILFAISRFRWGAALVYYTLWLSVVLVLVTHSDVITGIFNSANITQGQF